MRMQEIYDRLSFLEGLVSERAYREIANIVVEIKDEAVGKFAIDVEKLLCKKLNIEWSAMGISIESLVDRLAAKEGAGVPTSPSSIIDTIQPWTMEHLKGYPKAALEILNKRIAEANSAVMPAAPSDAVPDALADLRAAVAFLDQVRAAHDNGDDVNGTGAAKDARQWLERAARAALSQTMQPQAEPAAGEQAGAVAYQGPKKFTAEEVADGNLGIRWVTAESVMGRPSSHDVMEYLKRNTGAMCNCERCRAFFPALAAPGAAIAAREQEVK